MGSGSDAVLVRDDDDGVRWLTINRPTARNAINLDVLERLRTATASADRDGGIRAVVITGAGERAFCAGADLDELMAGSAATAARLLTTGQEVFSQIAELDVPTVAAVRGWALGGGFELALACTLIVAAASARFGLPETGVGLIPGFGGTQRLPRAIGPGPARRVILTGALLSAEEAWQLGLLARIPVAESELDEATRELCAALVARDAIATQTALRALCDDTLSTSLWRETGLALTATLDPELRQRIATERATRARPRNTTMIQP